MKTLVVLLLLAVALGAGHWTAQRPGEGLDAFVDEARRTVARLGDEVRDGVDPLVRKALAGLPESEADEVGTAGIVAGAGGAPEGEVAADGAPARLGGALPVGDTAGDPTGGTAVDPAAVVGMSDTADMADMASLAVAATGTPTEPETGTGTAPTAGVLAADAADALGSRIAALENELTRTMTSSESDVVQSRLDDTERRLVESERRLDETLAEIETTGTALAGATAGAASGTDAVDAEADVALALARMDAIDGQLALIVRRLDEGGSATRETLGGLGDRVEALGARLERADTGSRQARDALADRLETLAERTETLDARVGTFARGDDGAADDAPMTSDAPTVRALAATGPGPADIALSATTLRVPGLARFTGDGNEAVTSAVGDDAGTGAGASVDAPALAGVDRRLSALEATLRADIATARRPSVLDETLVAMTARLDALAERDARREDALEALEAAVGDLATTSDALSIDAVQGEVRDEIASLAAEVGSDAQAEGADNAELVAALETTRERVAELEERVRGLPASSAAAGDAQQTQSALESQIRALGKRIETLPSAPDAALADGLDDVRERVDALSSQGFVTQEELRAQVAGRNVEYKIYFDKNSTEIGDEAATVLDSFIDQETDRTAGVSIFGFTDTKGAASYNQQLAQRRAANVRSYLIRNGFDYTKIDNVAGLGEDASAAVLGDEQEDAGQRVVVLFAAQI